MSNEAAYHEAGHAVLARKSAFHILYDTVELSAYNSGFSPISVSKKKLALAGKPVNETADSDPEVAKDFAIILCGGLVAEIIAKEKGCEVSPYPQSSLPDHNLARNQLIKACLSDKLKPYEVYAKDILETNWLYVETLAKILICYGKCDAVDILDIVPE